MKTILFQLSNLSYRGTLWQTLKYANYNETILGNKSIFAFDSKLLNEDNGPDSSKAKEIVKMISDRFLTIEYQNKEALEFISKDCDYKYLLKYGFPDEHDVKSCKNLNHVVFNCNQPHGHRYSYISKWLAKAASGDENNYVPHIIDLPTCALDFNEDKVCLFYTTSRCGTLEHCIFESDKLLDRRGENGLGSLVPCKNCILWRNNNE